ncbi:hypothetical protein BMF94_5659 [Rhodotorula taiwanensis]|uniref:Uncharacterized protein n=1 Tax=Rhodotorula taiwanensis TaxID=741276 RepID=A0A2S5B3J4_9BASI|nr:hypothetical protein BMF94_5659 [Rhodotorula taiwanensis]
MDHSFGSSTSVLDTPTNRHGGLSSSVLNRNQLASSIAPSGPVSVQPLSFKPQSLANTGSQGAGVVKSVRFSPAQPNYSNGSPHGSASPAFSAAPPSRLQSFATPPRSYGSPSLLRTATGNASAGTSTPPRQQQQQQQLSQHSQPQQRQPSQQAASGQSSTPQGSTVHQHPAVEQFLSHLPHLATPQSVQSAISKSSSAVHEGIQHAGAEAKKKLEVMPIGRGEAQNRLKVNAGFLVAWWVSYRSNPYRTATAHLAAAVPQIDTPLHIGETLLLLVLCWNILDALRLLNNLSSLPPSATSAPLLTSSPALKRSPAVPSLGSPARSSPKTRATPSMFGSPAAGHAGSPLRPNGAPSSPFRASVLRGSPHPPTPQTPTSALLRGSPSLSVTRSAATSAVSSRSGSEATMPAPSDEIKGALLAYEARHGEQFGSPVRDEPIGGRSPATARVKVESREDVERLLAQ